MDSRSVQADFFLPSITMDFMHICQAFCDGLVNPFVHFIFILIEPVTAKDAAASKRWRGDFSEVFLRSWIRSSQRVPPGYFQHIVRIVRPLRAGLLKEATLILNRSSAESPPIASLFGFLL